MLYISPYTLFLAIIVVVLVLTRIIQICQIRRTRRRQQRQAEARWNEILSGSNLLYNGVTINLPRGGGAVPISLNTEDRIKLYKRTFEQTKLNHTLTEQDFQSDENHNDDAKDETNDKNHDVESAYNDQELYCDDEEAPTIYLDLTKDTSSGPTKVESDENSSQQQQNIDQDDDNKHNNQDSTNDDDNSTTTNLKSRTKITGTCIICFEHFRVGDVVVKSENTHACQHVFHEDCMVRFLASNSERNKPSLNVDDAANNNNNNNHNSMTTSYSNNPCPTCRHPFCTVSQDDIVLSVLLKSMRVAILQNQQQQQQQQTNNNPSNDQVIQQQQQQQDVENPPSLANLSVIPEESSQDIESLDVILRISNPDDEHDQQDSRQIP